MEPKVYYANRIVELEKKRKGLRRRKSVLGALRVGTIVAICAVLYLLWSVGIFFAIAAGILLLAVFIRVLFTDLNNQAAIGQLDRLLQVNRDEQLFLQGSFHQFGDGAAFSHEDHLYANDLDIFGKSSLFQYLNRTSSEMGSHALADYLKSPAPLELIRQRQQAVAELPGKMEWIQDLQAAGNRQRLTMATRDRLESWALEPPVFSGFRHWRWLRYVLPAIILTVVTGFAFDAIPARWFYFSLLLFAVIAYQVNKYVAPIHEQLSRIADELQICSVTIRQIENEHFSAPLLQQLQSAFGHSPHKASHEIRTLQRLLDRLDIRYNILISLPLNLLLLWNLQQVLGLEKWKATRIKNIRAWFDSLGQIEALNSLAVLRFNKPAWVFPEIVPGYFQLQARDMGHPLITETKRVNNDISIDHSGELMLVTGSNMAGKSTYLRSAGINVILGMAGSAVCASTCRMSHVHLVSSMRIADNLAESTSTFYAELKKLKTIIDKVNAGEEVFILLDEILRGTNSLDRHTGSVALMKQLIRHRAAAMIATHDLELASLIREYPENIINYHFDVQVSNDELYFDYRLKPGVCNSMNASILMKKIGIEL